MDREIEDALARLQRVNDSMDALAETVKKQCAEHIRKIEESMAKQTLFLESL